MQITYLEVSYAKRIIVVPFLSLITAFFFLLFLFWYPRMRKRFLYSECAKVTEATHIYVNGTSKYRNL
jgi:hypothetical protein